MDLLPKVADNCDYLCSRFVRKRLTGWRVGAFVANLIAVPFFSDGLFESDATGRTVPVVL